MRGPEESEAGFRRESQLRVTGRRVGGARTGALTPSGGQVRHCLLLRARSRIESEVRPVELDVDGPVKERGTFDELGQRIGLSRRLGRDRVNEDSAPDHFVAEVE